MLISLDINLAAAVKMEDFTSAVDHLFQLRIGRHNWTAYRRTTQFGCSARSPALIGVPLIGVHLMVASLMGVHFMGVYLTGCAFL